MIQDTIKIYFSLFRGLIVLSLGSGLLVGGINMHKSLSRRALVRGLIHIPGVGK